MCLDPTEPTPSIIRSFGKGKIGKAESFPIGAELISDALRGLPMFHQLGIAFGPFGSSSRTWAGVTQLPVMFVQYQLEWISGTALGPWWHIYVHVVPRDIKGLIKANLVESGLREVRRWLESKTHVWSSDGTHRLSLVWDIKRKEILFEKHARPGPRVVRKGHAHP